MKSMMDDLKSLNSEESKDFLKQVELKFRGMFEEAGNQMEEAKEDGFQKLSAVKRRIMYRSMIESAKESSDAEEFASQVEEFKSKAEQSNKDELDMVSETCEEVIDDVRFAQSSSSASASTG